MVIKESGPKHLEAAERTTVMPQTRQFLPERGLELNCIRQEDETSLSSSDSGDSGPAKDQNARGGWTGKLDFMLSCIGYAVGLGNIWRFPYICYTSGGGAFLVPYFIFLVLCGMPMFVLELCFGQFGSQGPITLFRISPLFKGLGYGMLIISAVVCIYYNIIITWTLYYIYLSFSRELPWASCGNPWNSDNCVSADHVVNTSSIASSAAGLVENASIAVVNATTAATTAATSSSEFWTNYVLQISPGIEQLGGIRPELLTTLAIAWIIIFACLFRGVESSGKVVYVSATFPYLVLTILLVRGLTLDGAMTGIQYFLEPKWEKLAEFEVWGKAASQLFYSVGAAWGSILTMASYNKFNHQCYRDALIVPVVNCLTSLFAGMVVFSIVGFMAHATGQEIGEVIKQGPGLVFIAYPEAVARLPLSPLWAFLFFSMILTIGIDSQFGMFECVISGIVDELPWLRPKKVLFTLAMCVLLFVLGLPCVTEGGMYVLTLMDWYAAAFSLMVICLLECVVVSWIYGDERFCRDIEMMIGRRPHMWFRLCWKYITPFTISFVLLFSLIHHTPVEYGGYKYPSWGIAVGWMVSLASMLPIPVLAVVVLLSKKGSFKERLVASMRPDPLWGPALQANRVAYRKSLDEFSARFPQLYVSGVDTAISPSESAESNAV